MVTVHGVKPKTSLNIDMRVERGKRLARMYYFSGASSLIKKPNICRKELIRNLRAHFRAMFTLYSLVHLYTATHYILSSRVRSYRIRTRSGLFKRKCIHNIA